MKVHIHTKFCFICLLTFIFHHCNDCHGETQHHASEENHIQLHNDYQISEEPYLKNGAVELSTSKTLGPEILPEAEHEQKYYIEKLFHRYGEDGRLSFYGLEKLLASLGLGEVKIVEIGHEDIGHDHVSHLDALDLQEGKHIHEHNDLGSHVDLENETKTTSDYHKCDIRKTDSSESVQTKASRHTHLHHHGRDINGHLHNSSHHSHNTTGGHVEQDGQRNEPLADTNTTHEHPDQKTRKHKKRRKGKKNGETTIDSVSELGLEHSSDEAYDRNHVHKPGHDYDHSHDHNHNANHDFEEHRPVDENRHRNTQKREAPHEHINVNKFDINIISTQNQKEHGEEFHEHDECLNVSQLLHYYGLNLDSPISPEQFAYLCPALLYQIDSRFCIKHFADLQVENLEKSKAGASAWICGLISITVISLLSLLGVILIPIINQGCFKFLLNFLVALAVGTLSGDALLHLLPHSQGGHDHGTAEHGHNHAEEVEHVSDQTFLQEYDSVMKGLVALGGIYLLFIVEHCLHMFKHYKEQKGKQKWLKRKQKVDESSVGRKLSDHKLNRRSDAEWLQLKPVAGTIDGVTSEGQRLDETEMTYVESFQQTPMKVFVPVDEEMPHINKDGSSFDDHSLEDLPYENNHEKTDIQKKHNHSKHSHHSHGHCHSGKDMKDTGIANIAWMVIMGDGMHNFSDGLAIGAAFSAGLTGGISTSVAVFCHELPHELGDFAVLLKAGMTVNQAIVYNLLSAMMAYVGMLIGTAVGQYANNITHWIFAVTAGMFLYVALVDMLPEMLHGDEEESGHCALGQFILQNLGLLLGFAIMLVIALYEDKIVFDIQF